MARQDTQGKEPWEEGRSRGDAMRHRLEKDEKYVHQVNKPRAVRRWIEMG